MKGEITWPNITACMVTHSCSNVPHPVPYSFPCTTLHFAPALNQLPRSHTLPENTTCHSFTLLVYNFTLQSSSLLERLLSALSAPSTHPLFIQFKELLCDFGRAERQSQTGHVEFGDDLFQDLFEWQTPNGALLPRRRHCIF